MHVSYCFKKFGANTEQEVWGFVPSFIGTSYAVFGWYPWDACCFWRVAEEKWEKGGVGKLGEVEAWKAETENTSYN